MLLRLTSTVDAGPFLVANCCFIDEMNSWILVLHSFLVNSSQTPSTVPSLKTSRFGIFCDNAFLNDCSMLRSALIVS